MYNEQIENLISAALADGTLTEKEKQVLMKRAEAQGIDLDEFEIILDARLVESKKAEKTNAASSKKKKKRLNEYVEIFAEELQTELDSQVGTSLWNIFDYTGILKEMRLRNAKFNAESTFVTNYPLPTTEEDCIEMLNYMLPRIHLSGSTAATKAWRIKFHAILSKLALENNNDPKIQKLIDSYRKQAEISILGNFIIWYKSLPLSVKIISWTIISYFIVFTIILPICLSAYL